MDSKKYYRFIILSMSLLAFLVGCESQPTPTKADIISHLEKCKKFTCRVSSLDFKAFPSSNNAGTGRISISGVIESTESLYSVDQNKSLFIMDLKQQGLAETVPYYTFLPKAVKYTSYWDISYKTGHRFDISTELTYIETAKGFRFSGAPDIKTDGKPKSMVPKNDLIRGSERYSTLVKEIVNSSQIFEQKFTTVKNKIEHTLKHPFVILRYLDGKSNWEHFYSLKTRFPINYKNSSTWGHIEFRTTGEVTLLKAHNRKIEVTITGTIRYPGHNPSYSGADIYIQDEDANLHEPFRGREHFAWKNDIFMTPNGNGFLGIARGGGQ